MIPEAYIAMDEQLAQCRRDRGHGSLPGRGIPTKVVDLAVHRGGWYTVLDASARVHQFGRGTIFGSLGERGIGAKPIALAAS